MVKNKILFVCGSQNQAKILYEISRHLEYHDCYFTTNNSEVLTSHISRTSLFSNRIAHDKSRRIILEYLSLHNLNIDISGENENYDLVFSCTESGIPKNIKFKQSVFVQEGIPGTKNYLYQVAKQYGFAGLLTSNSKLKLNDVYSKFCVASEAYKQNFINQGVDADKIIVTGIPGLDNYTKYLNNDFLHSGYVLTATSDSRENFNFENRERLIYESVEIAADRKLIFKLHPNENFDRAIWEINNYAPEALIFVDGEIGEMIANCNLLITRNSSAAFIGLALNKKVHTENDISELKRLMPVQNGGTSAMNVAFAAEKVLKEEKSARVFYFPPDKLSKLNFIQRYKMNQKLPFESV